MIARRAGERLLDTLHSRGWVTWERIVDGANVLTVTNAWPSPDRPALGIFLKDTVAGLEDQGLATDVLFIRGHRGLGAYAMGALLLAVLPLLRRGRYRIVNSHGGETALAARCFWSCPVIATYWGSDLLGPQVGPWRRRLKVRVMSRLIRAHARLMTATTTKSREMERVLPRRVQPRNWVIPDGVDRERFAPGDASAARRALGWPEVGPIVISVGREHPLKRLDLAQEAVRRARAAVPGLSWRAVSSATPEEMPLVYQAADCLLHTSMSEGSSNAVKEALACDLPVVATPAGDIVELLAGVRGCAVSGADPDSLARALVLSLSAGRSDGRERTAWLGREPIAAQIVRLYTRLGLALTAAGDVLP